LTIEDLTLFEDRPGFRKIRQFLIQAVVLIGKSYRANTVAKVFASSAMAIFPLARRSAMIVSKEMKA
jgi:hypothetical protein